MNLFINRLFTDPQTFFMWILAVVFSICCHEYAHAQMALWQGDTTARDNGHLTLNPLKQMGLFSLVMLAVVGLAWGQVPVNKHRMRHNYSAALTAFAGPLMNVLLFLASCVLCAVSIRMNFNPAAGRFFMLAAGLNGVLFMLNMLPVPPLDGAEVLRFLLPKYDIHNSEFAKGLTLLLIIIVFISIDYLYMISFTAAKYIIALLAQA